MGLHTKVSNLIRNEVDVGDAGVVLQHLRQSLPQQVKSNGKGKCILEQNWACTPRSPIRLSLRLILVTLELCFSASAKACGSRVTSNGKGKCGAKVGLHTKISNLIVLEVDIGDAGVVLQRLRQSLQQQGEIK